MRLGTRASVFTAASLLACGPIGAAYATVESPSPTPVESPSPTPVESPTPSPSAATEEPSEEPAGTHMPCTAAPSDTEVTIDFQPPAAFEDLTVTAHGDPMPFSQAEQTSVVVDRMDADVTLLVEVWDAENQQSASCDVVVPMLSESPEPAEPSPSETDTPSDETGSPEPPETSPTTPSTPTPEPEDTPEPSTPTSPTSPTAPSPTPPGPAEDTPASPQAPTTTAPSVPYPPPEASSAPAETSPDTTSPSDSPSADHSDRHVPRHIRPHAESPRYLLPQLLGIESHRGSPLVMPRPRETGDEATELETLPPISEDELEAIKAQLSSPGRADNTPTGAHLESTTPTERVSDQNSWWLLAGLTSVIGISAVASLLLNRRKRQH